MGLLDRYSLVHKVGGSNYNIHPLVHSWTRVCKVGQQTISLEVRARVAIVMLVKTHDKKLDRFSEQRKSLQAKFANHMESCVGSTQRYTKLLDPTEAPTLRADTILAIRGMLQGHTLSREHKERQLLPGLGLLALINGSRLAGLDDISTLDALRSIIGELPEILPGCIDLVGGLFHMAFELLPIATSRRQNSDLACTHLLWLALQALLTMKQKPEKFDAAVQETITFTNWHRDEIAKASYFCSKCVVLGVPKPQGIDYSKTLILIEEYLLECEEQLGSPHYYTTMATIGKASCLIGLDRFSEAENIFRTIYVVCRTQIEKVNLVSQALTGIMLALLLQKSASSELMQTTAVALELEREEHGDFHESVLNLKVGLLRYEAEAEKEPNESKLNLADVHERGDGMDDEYINLTLKLAIMYKIFGKQREISLLWEGVMTQAKLEVVSEDMLDFSPG